MHLLIEQSTQHLGIGTIDRDASKHVVPAVGKGLKPFLLGAVREAINRGLHEVDELECRITRDMRAKENRTATTRFAYSRVAGYACARFQSEPCSSKQST